MAKTLTIKEKILAFLNESGIKKADFFRITGIQSSNFKGKNIQSAPGSDTLVKILTHYPQLSAEWLLTGEGEMLKNESAAARGAAQYLPSGNDKVTKNNSPKRDLETKSLAETRPRIPFTAAAGALSIATGSADEGDCERFPVIHTFPDYDFTIIIEGDSMAPDYLSGDELACAFLNSPADIQWGKPYILDTADGVVFKRIYDGGDSIMCTSINPAGPSFIVNKQELLHIASVVGYVRHT